MNLTGNTIFVTGGGSGIGRGLAETLHRLGNQVIISGRRKGHLAETTKANPGMKSVELDVEDPASIAAVTRKLIEDYPKLNVLINNAGVMHIDNAAGAIDEALLVSTIATNLMGPIRMTGALIDHLKKQDHAAVMNVSSVLGFVPLAMAAVYSSTNAYRFNGRGVTAGVGEHGGINIGHGLRGLPGRRGHGAFSSALAGGPFVP